MPLSPPPVINIPGNAASATTAAACTGNAASATTAAACTGNAASATTATALGTASGAAPSYACRAWVNFNGTGTVAIKASGNVTSITDNGLGDYTVNFATSMADGNYASAFGTTNSGNSGAGYSGNLSYAGDATPAPVYKTVSGMRVVAYVGNSNFDAGKDIADMSIAVFR